MTGEKPKDLKIELENNVEEDKRLLILKSLLRKVTRDQTEK